MLKEMHIKNFRCLVNVRILFDEKATVIVGENDSGKTAIIDSLRIVFGDKKIELDDFFDGSENVVFEITLDDGFYSINIDTDGNKSIFSRMNRGYLEETWEKLSGESYNLEQLKHLARQYGVTVRHNSRYDTLKSNLQQELENALDSTEDDSIFYKIDSLPLLNTYILDGKHFQDVSSFLHEIYFREKQKNIWKESVDGEITIEDFINDKLSEYSSELKYEIERKGIKDKIKNYIPDLTDIHVESMFEPKALSVSVNVKLLDNDSEINITKKGDGTKRRITMALLEYKKEEDEGGAPMYIFDEPDTHLHVKAQKELVEILCSFVNSGRQLIFTTHSPFIINSFNPYQIRLLTLNSGVASVKYLSNEKQIENTLKNLGIENVYLFFAQKILIVEGETEEEFVPVAYKNIYNKTLSSSLIKLIKREGITDVPRFANVIQDFIRPKDVFILIDNDENEETEEIISELKIPEENIFRVGYKEFEDALEPSYIYNAWKTCVESCEREISASWSIGEITKLKEECLQNNKKFSKGIRQLNSGSKRMTKPILGKALANYLEIDKECLPKELNDFFKRLEE